METKVQKQIIDYYSFFKEFYNTSKTCLNICQNCAISINKLIRRCNNIKEANVIGTPLEEFEGLQSKLLSALHNLISEEIREIQRQRAEIEEAFDKLSNKHKVLLSSIREIDSSQQTLLVKGTSLQPPLKQILEFTEDTLTFGAEISAQVETSLHVLSFKGLNTECLIDNFKISTVWQKKISEILAYTSFCSENEI